MPRTKQQPKVEQVINLKDANTQGTTPDPDADLTDAAQPPTIRTIKDLRIFICYSHDDGPLATRLSNLLQAAFGPALEKVFVDTKAIDFGTDIKESVMADLKRADLLVAVLTGAQPASVLSWPGYEIGVFLTGWADEHYKHGAHKNREKWGIIGKVVIVNNAKLSLGPQEGQKPVDLGITQKRLSDGATPEKLTKARSAAALENDELLQFIKDIEVHVKGELEYDDFAKQRNRNLSDLVCDCKLDAFDILRNRVRSRSKPAKQLLVRSRKTGSSLKDDVKIISVAGASEVFGKAEGEPGLFKKTGDGMPGSEHYETNWGEFKTSVATHAYGAYWCGVIEQAVIGATREGVELDPNLVLISTRGQRYRVIATTVTTFFNDDSEVSLYLIEALQRRALGDPETSKLLNLLIIICRFKFAFLERESPYYWRNIGSTVVSPKDLLMELDYLKSEAINAHLEQPGAWEVFMTPEKLNEMKRIWDEVDLELRQACNAAIAQGGFFLPSNELTDQIVTQLKRIFEEVKPFNTLLGIAVSARMLNVFNDIQQAENAEQNAEQMTSANSTPSAQPDAPSARRSRQKSKSKANSRTVSKMAGGSE